MKTKLISSSLFIAALSVSLQALAQPAATDSRDRDAYGNSQRHLGKLDKASKIIGTEVKNSQDQKLGHVKDLAIDMQNGRIVEVIVGTGGVLGMNERYVAVPPDQFTCDQANKTLQLNIEKDRFKGAPEFKLSAWDENMRQPDVTEVYQYYNTRPYFISDIRTSPNMPINADDTSTNRVNNMRKNDSPRDPAMNNNNKPMARTDMHANRMATPSLGDVERASKIIGTTARNTQGDKLGKIENLIVDLPAGRLVEVVLATGGFLGMGDELSAIPPQSFHHGVEHDQVVLDATKDSLSRAPHFKSSEWPNLDTPDYGHVDSVYRSYNVDRYYATNDVDNSAQNVRDRQANAVTPLSQGNSELDLKTTQQIRQQIMAVDGLSIDAKNVKVITVDGRVTLRGPVDNQNEKQQITDIANRVATQGNVDNQLQVKDSSNSIK